MRTWHLVTSGLQSLFWTVLRKKSQQFSQQGAELLPIRPCKLLKNTVEAYRCWCAAWTSNPVIGANPLDGGFDSHTLPPHFSISAGQLPRSLLRCEVFSWDARELSDQLSRHFCSVL